MTPSPSFDEAVKRAAEVINRHFHNCHVESVLRQHLSHLASGPVEEAKKCPPDWELANIFSEAYSLAQAAYEAADVDTGNHGIKEQCGLAGIKAVREAIMLSRAA